MNNRLISLILTIVLLSSSVAGTFASAEGVVASETTLKINQGKDTGALQVEATGETFLSGSMESEEWEQYVGDIETFVYGLIINQLEYFFDVFPGYVELSNGNHVYGIAYTDYSDCYTNEEESLRCFEAGFIPFVGEPVVYQEEIETGLLITGIDFEDEATSFLWSYDTDSFTLHCVVYNQYLQYGIDENKAIFYETSEYVPGICDEALGSLYSYDEAKFLYDTEVGSYIRIQGDSLFNYIDFDEMEKEINAIIRTQDINSATVDVVSCAYIAQEVILSYLTSLQEETFLGYNVSELVEVAEEIDPLECIRITPDGLVTLRIEEDTKASDLCKLLVGTGCVIVTAVTIAGSCVFVECPFLSGLSTAVAGIAIETLMQVVISEKPLDSVDWHKIAISAVVGAVSGWIGPYVLATTEANSFSYYVLDSAIDGLLGGIEQTVEAWMDGEDAARIISSFGMGSALGFALSAGFKGIAAGMSKMAPKLNTVTKRLAEKLPKTITDKARAIKLNAIDILKEMKERADSSLFHSEYISRKMAERQIGRLVSQNSDELMDKSINTLSADNIYDVQGVKINKDKLKSIAKDATDGATVAYFEYGDEFAEIIKKNSMVGVVFDQKYQTVIIPGGLTENRGVNFENVATLLKEQWIDTPDLIPKSIAEAIADIGQVEELMPRDLVRIIQSNKDWVIHENIDRISATLVPRNLHSDIKHMGGVGLAKYLKSHMGKEYFDRLVSVAATYTVIAVH